MYDKLIGNSEQERREYELIGDARNVEFCKRGTAYFKEDKIKAENSLADLKNGKSIIYRGEIIKAM